MFQRKPRRFRRRQNDRNQISRGVNNNQVRLRSNSFSTGHSRNNYRPTQSPEKLLEKYNTLAKEAMASGDKTLYENFLQHADHFTRIIEDKNRNKDQSKINVINKPLVDDKNSSKSSGIEQENTIKNKE